MTAELNLYTMIQHMSCERVALLLKSHEDVRLMAEELVPDTVREDVSPETVRCAA